MRTVSKGYQEHKKQFRTMKDGKQFALDTLDRHELIQSAELCLNTNQGDPRYREKAKNIVADAKALNGNLYVTLPMRRVLMGFIRPVFEQEYQRRNQPTKLNEPQKQLRQTNK